MVSYIGQSDLWCQPPSPRQKPIHLPIITSEAASSQIYPQQDRISNFLFDNDPIPSGLQRAIFYSSSPYLLAPQDLFLQNNNVLSDPEVQTTSSISDNGYPHLNTQHPSFSPQSQDFAYSIYDASSPRPEPAIDPSLTCYHARSPDVYYEEYKTDFNMTVDECSWQAPMNYNLGSTQYSSIYHSPIDSPQVNENFRSYAPHQDPESWRDSNTTCNSNHQAHIASYNTQRPQTRQHSRRFSSRSTQMKREESTSSNEDERKPIRTRVKATKRPRRQHVCHECPKEKHFKNKSELRKHRETQHTKPYYCFFKLCGKNFGARNEWKRHIITQHLQLATWKCDRSQCVEKPEFNRKDLFIKHLERMHKTKSQGDTETSEAKWKEQCIITEKKCIQPRTPPQVFICGYCDESFSKGDLAWSNFIDHVGLHYQNGDDCAKNIMDWREDRNLTQWCSDHGLGGSSTESSENNMDDECSGTCCHSDCQSVKMEDSDSG